MDVALLFLYIILGLSAFILPRFVHYAKEVLEALDAIAITTFILKFVSIVSDINQLHNADWFQQVFNPLLMNIYMIMSREAYTLSYTSYLPT